MNKRITYGFIGIILLSAAGIAEGSQPDTLTVQVLGMHENSRFEPAELNISAGDVIRFIIKEGVHTVTAYHPDNRRPLRIPENADSFDSGPLQAGDHWYLKIQLPGEYNYFCLPHERFGHMGKITALTNNKITQTTQN